MNILDNMRQTNIKIQTCWTGSDCDAFVEQFSVRIAAYEKELIIYDKIKQLIENAYTELLETQNRLKSGVTNISGNKKF